MSDASEEGREQVDPRLRDAIRQLQDEEYEASTRIPGSYRSNLARRHRFDRVNAPLDERLAARDAERARRREADPDVDASLVLGAVVGGIGLGLWLLGTIWLLASDLTAERGMSVLGFLALLAGTVLACRRRRRR